MNNKQKVSEHTNTNIITKRQGSIFYILPPGNDRPGLGGKTDNVPVENKKGKGKKLMNEKR